jgi:hypothetical protein
MKEIVWTIIRLAFVTGWMICEELYEKRQR